MIDGLGAGDVKLVVAFAGSHEHVGEDLTEAIFMPPPLSPARRRRWPPPRLAGRAGCRRPDRPSAVGFPVIKGLVAEAAPLLKSPPGTAV
ncbi:hypothetical protein ACFY3U_11035 [Micromonospora sp. NPDC000089]|uniref:hypothetical protein n=1 Tax=unclassified Micromonospora TaxID=2617518 RepID=UPI0036756D2B